jgi:hypothetical protein
LSGVDGEEPMPGHSVTNKMREQHFIEDGLKISSLGDAGPLLDNQAKRASCKTLFGVDLLKN